MNKPKTVFSIAAFFLVCLFASTNSFAQNAKQFEPSYEVVLQVLIASNAAPDKSVAVPQTLSNVLKKLKTNYSFSNYRLDLTYLQRVTNTGNIELRSVSNASNQDVYAPIFSEFTLGQLMNLPDAKGQNSISIQNFRFGQRVPIRTGGGESGKSNVAVNYDQIGLSMQKVSLPVNAPTVVGTLSTSKPDELMFLVLTVKPVEE